MPNPNYEMAQLEQYIGLMQHLTGITPKMIYLRPDFWTWYVQTVGAMAEAFGMTPGFAGGRVQFKGVQLVKKSDIETADVSQPVGEPVPVAPMIETAPVPAAPVTPEPPAPVTPEPAPAVGVPAVEAAPVTDVPVTPPADAQPAPTV